MLNILIKIPQPPWTSIPAPYCCHLDECFMLRPAKGLWSTRVLHFVLDVLDFTFGKQKSPHSEYLPEIVTTWHSNELPHRVVLITFLNSPVLWYSHSIMSKKIGIVAFRSSTSGIRVISKMGPTIPGIKQILFCPETQTQIVGRCLGQLSSYKVLPVLHTMLLVSC